MSLSKELLNFLDMPESITKLSKEIRTVMSKVQELQDAVNEMKSNLATEAEELFAKMEALQAQIDARVDPSSLQPIIDSVKGTAENIEALSEGRPVTPAPMPEIPTETAPDAGATAPVEGGVAEPGATEPAATEGGDTAVDTGAATGEPTQDAGTGGEASPAEPMVPTDSGASTGTVEGSENTDSDTAGVEEVSDSGQGGSTSEEGGTGSEEEPRF